MLTLEIERTLDNRTLHDRVPLLEAQVEVLKARIRVLEQQLGERASGKTR